MRFPHPISDMNWGERIAEAREANSKMPQKDLGKAIGAAQQTVASWETGGKQPPLEMFERIAQVTGFRACWLAFGHLPKREGEGDGDAAPRGPTLERERLFQTIYALEMLLAREGMRMTPEAKARVLAAAIEMRAALPTGSSLLGLFEQLLGLAKRP